MEHKDLGRWQAARDSANRIRRMTLRALPEFEGYELLDHVTRKLRRFKPSVETNHKHFQEDAPGYNV